MRRTSRAYQCPVCGAGFNTPVECSGVDPEPGVDLNAHAPTRAEENPHLYDEPEED